MNLFPKVFIFLFFIFTLFFVKKSFSQSYSTLKIKEEFDLFESQKSNLIHPFVLDTIHDEDKIYGISFLIDAYLNMYKTTKDKSYLYMCIFQTLRIMEVRHDYANINNEKRWVGSRYRVFLDGYILGAMSKFVYLIKIEEQALQSTPLFQFPEIAQNNFNITFQTFGDYINWLDVRINETLEWYISHSFWSDNYGIKKDPNDQMGAEVNMQVGFGRSFLFMGLSDSNSDYIFKAQILNSLFRIYIEIPDNCSTSTSTIYPLLRLNSTNNSYWWYHAGWRLEVCDNGRVNPDKYLKYLEDASHGFCDIQLIMDFYNYLPNSNLTNIDMVRFRNTFAKNIMDANGGFHKAVNGTNNNVYPSIGLDYSILNYMPLTLFDGLDNTATPPDVYNLILDFYIQHYSNQSQIPDTPYSNNYASIKGISEVLFHQWEIENTNLTIYNRFVIYDQDFFAKNTLKIAPKQYDIYHQSLDSSYAVPKYFQEDKFIINHDVSSNLYAGNEIIFEDGVEIFASQNKSTHVFINNVQTITQNVPVNDFSNYLGENQKTTKQNDTIEIENTQNLSDFNIYPNPFSNYFNIQFTIQKTCHVNIKLIDNFGSIVFNNLISENFQEGNYTIPFSSDLIKHGFYRLVIFIDKKYIFSKTILKME